MKFLIDEDVPIKVISSLISLGHDAVRVKSSSRDQDIAKRARKESRILVTLDKDFCNKFLYPPSDITIIQVRIHPPSPEPIVAALSALVSNVDPSKLKGHIVLRDEGPSKFSK
jgi:predicted nuclease of predicted toxin-antitoxin system